MLGGGVSWLARSHGLAANTVTALEVVTADGAARRVDADHDPELFWAPRGGGGDQEVRRWWTGGSYLNFAEAPRTPEELFGRETAARLAAVKAAVDPTGLLRSNHPVR